MNDFNEKYKKNFYSSKKDKDEFVSTILINKEGKVFVFIRADNLKLDAGKKDLISGHIKEEEIPVQAMFREIKEETGIMPDEIKEFYVLGEISLPHPLIKNKKTHMYCAVIDYTMEQLRESIDKKATEKEIKDVEQMESLQELIEDIKLPTTNWRIYFTEELGQKVNLACDLLKKDNKDRDINEI